MSTEHNQIHRGESANLISAERVKGTPVFDEAGERVGSIDSVMLTKESGKIAYAIMSFGGFLGIGEKFHPLPWHTLDYDTDLGGYRLPTAADKLRDAPQFGRETLDAQSSGDDAWPQTTDRYYAAPGVLGPRPRHSPADRI